MVASLERPPEALGLLVWPFGLPVVLGFAVVLPRASGSCSTAVDRAGVIIETACTSGGGPAGWMVAAIVMVAAGAPLLVAAYLYRVAGRAGSDR